ncbi:copia protein [Lasius niger]|uniref:Copia protein n=1 Tax=Lasius niger TaxID=67767 RepID=A0A0J7N723_LASNI|nr:copia protein [Lasius niger]
MSEEISTRNIPKFDGKNFQGWKFQLKTLFTAYGIKDVVDGTRKMPDDTQCAAAKAWVRENAKAMHVISTSLEFAQLEPLLECETANDMWEKLCRIHEQRSASNKLMITQKFHEYRMSPGDSVVQHVSRVQNMAAQLIDMGETVTDVTIMARILASLSPKYGTFRTAWDSVDQDRQTVENLQERLIREEARLNDESDNASALAAVGKTRSAGRKVETGAKDKNKSRKLRKDIECFKCGKKGHFARECKNNRSEKKTRDDSESRETRDCAFVVEASGKTSNKCSKEEESAVDKAGRQILSADLSDVWITDSGASKHITYRREWFNKFEVTNRGDSVSLGDNKKYDVVGEGTILIEKFVDGAWREAQIKNVIYVPEIKKNLFSVGKCTQRMGLKCISRTNKC